MRVLHSTAAGRAFIKAPRAVQKAFLKQIELLSEDLRHPSLRAKKYDPSGRLWQARVDRNWRFYFTIEDDVYVIQDLIPHPK